MESGSSAPGVNERPLYVVSLRRDMRIQRIAADPDVQDAFYAYRVAQLVVSRIGISKRRQTHFTNIQDVARDLRVPSHYLLHFLAISVGSRVVQHYGERGCCIAGQHLVTDISNGLVQFLKGFVLCGYCHLPELRHEWETQGKKLKQKGIACLACGRNYSLEDLPLPDEFKKYVTEDLASDHPK